MMDREVKLNRKNETQTGDLRLKKNTREKQLFDYKNIFLLKYIS